jgi:ABC-type transport system involved in cytochrome bd biosynthesis fused ATPase/permease subunit
MRVRTVQFRTRNPIVGAAVVLLVLAVLLAVFTVGLTLLAGLAVVGGAGLLVRRALRGGRGALEPPLDRTREVLPRDAALREVFPPGQEPQTRRLPTPGASTDEP